MRRRANSILRPGAHAFVCVEGLEGRFCASVGGNVGLASDSLARGAQAEVTRLTPAAKPVSVSGLTEVDSTAARDGRSASALGVATSTSIPNAGASVAGSASTESDRSHSDLGDQQDTDAGAIPPRGSAESSSSKSDPTSEGAGRLPSTKAFSPNGNEEFGFHSSDPTDGDDLHSSASTAWENAGFAGVNEALQGPGMVASALPPAVTVSAGAALGTGTDGAEGGRAGGDVIPGGAPADRKLPSGPGGTSLASLGARETLAPARRFQLALAALDPDFWIEDSGVPDPHYAGPIAQLLPFGRAGLEEAIDQFLAGFDHVAAEFADLETATAVVAIAGAVTVAAFSAKVALGRRAGGSRTKQTPADDREQELTLTSGLPSSWTWCLADP